MLAADEDFDTHRVLGHVDQGGAAPSGSPASGQPWTTLGRPSARSSTATPMVGDTRYVGTRCDPATIPAAARRQDRRRRGARAAGTFLDKIVNAEAKGYTGVIIFCARRAARFVQHA